MPTILCLGDSLTLGDDYLPTGFRTYRGTLQTLLATAGVANVDFIGPVQRVPAAGGQDPDVAAWGGATIDNSSGNFASNNLTSRLPTLKQQFPDPDLLVVWAGWNDVYNQSSNIASRYETFLDLVQSVQWASVKAIVCTLHPEPGKTEAQQNAASSAYAAINAKVRQLCAAAPTTRILADLAALAGQSSGAFVERIISRVTTVPTLRQIQGGGGIPNWPGGHRVTSFASMQGYNGQWSTNPPAAGVGNNGGRAGLNPSLTSVVNGTNLFVANVQSVVPWFWVWCGPGHASTNTCVEVRNGFAQGLHARDGWRFFFQGARFGAGGYISHSGGAEYGNPRLGHRSDGLTSWYAPDGNRGIEVWPADTVPSRGIIGFYGARNRELMANSRCFVYGAQIRLAKIDPNGPEDRASARFILTMGADYTREYSSDQDRYDRFGWPYTVQDGGSDVWELFTQTEWTLISGATIGKGGTGSTSTNSHWEDPGTPPPLSQYSYAHPYNDIPTYSISTDDLRSNPPRIPDYWEGAGGSGSGYSEVDYWLNPTTFSRDIHLNQSGADKVAGVISRAIITSGALAGGGGGGGGGGVIFAPLPGLPTRPNVFDRTESSLKAVAPKDYSTGIVPGWPETRLPDAVSGVPYAVTVTARGTPAPTYSIVSGAPGWLSINSTTGAISGTPTAGAAAHSLVLRATNSEGTDDIEVTLTVQPGVLIVTSSLPDGAVGAAYDELLQAQGAAPFAWTISSGALPAGLSLQSGIGGQRVAGTPSAAGLSSFTVQVTDAGTRTAARALSIAIAPPPPPPPPPPLPGVGQWTRVPRDAEVWIRVPRDEP
jgi:lysophospholipase L1-like esterase